MPYYELLCLAKSHLKRKELGDVLRKACRAFMDHGGTITRLVPLGAQGDGPRKLAYKIRQNQVTHEHAFFVNICAFSSTAAVAEVSRQLKIDERILRHGVFRRPLLDSLLPIPDADLKPNITRAVGDGDPDYELQKFLQEYRRDHPLGLNVLEAPTNDNLTQTEDESKFVEDFSQNDSVSDILAELKASSPHSSAGKDDFTWMSKLKKPDPSGIDSP